MQIKPLLMLSPMLVVQSAFGHAPDEATGIAWNFAPEVVLPLLLTVSAYASGIRHLQGRIVSRSHCFAFTLGILALVIALMSPLDLLAGVLFSAHMTQHLLLMLIAPPLLVLGRIELALLWALPLPLRRVIGHGWRKAAGLRFVAGLLSRPVSVWLLASAAMWFWHIPGPYAWAFYNPIIHILEHLSFLLTFLAFWALALRPISRDKSGHGVALMLLITFAMESALLGALLVFAGHPFYAVHMEEVSRQLPQFLADLSALQDQQLAGLIMWVPAGMVQLVAPIAVFADWLSVSQNRRLGSVES